MVYRSHGAPVAPLASAQDRGFSDAHVAGADYRVFSLATELDAATIHVAQPLARRTSLTKAAGIQLLAPGVGLLVLLVATVVWTVRRTTRPLVIYASALDALSVEDACSVDGSLLPVELQPVARAIEGLLARVHDSLLRERTLTADAAHELRNPLAALRLQAQVARRSATKGEADAALDELLAVIDRAARIVETMLILARLDARSVSTIGARQVNLGRLAHLIAAEFRPLAEARGAAISVNAEEVGVIGDIDALAVALRNLVANALRFARREIVIEVRYENDQAMLAVRDDGPGFSEDSAERAFHRFYRGPESERSTAGAGLGLALVLRIVQLHAGVVRLAPGIAGGAGVVIQLSRHMIGGLS